MHNPWGFVPSVKRGPVGVEECIPTSLLSKKGNFMKKIMLFMTTAAFLFAGCGQGGTQDTGGSGNGATYSEGSRGSDRQSGGSSNAPAGGSSENSGSSSRSGAGG